MRASCGFFLPVQSAAQPQKQRTCAVLLRVRASSASTAAQVRSTQTSDFTQRFRILHIGKLRQMTKCTCIIPRYAACAGCTEPVCSTDALSALLADAAADYPSLPVFSFSFLFSDRSSSHVGGLGSHRSLGGVLLLMNGLLLRLSRVACELKPSQVSAGNTDHSHCHVGISPAPEQLLLRLTSTLPSAHASKEGKKRRRRKRRGGFQLLPVRLL